MIPHSRKEGTAKRSFAGKRSSRGAYSKAAARRLCHAAKRAATRPCSASNKKHLSGASFLPPKQSVGRVRAFVPLKKQMRFGKILPYTLFEIFERNIGRASEKEIFGSGRLAGCVHSGLCAALYEGCRRLCGRELLQTLLAEQP